MIEVEDRLATEKADFLTALLRPTLSGQQRQEVVMAKQIPLTQGYYAIVDDEDYDLVAPYTWRLAAGVNTMYAYGYKRVWTLLKGTTTKRRFMHRLILGITDRKTSIDHINNNGLDNRKCNIRICSQSINAQRARRPVSRWGYIGIGRNWENNRHPWHARITKNGKSIRLGSFVTKVEAAEAYDRAAFELYGEHARTNFHVEHQLR